MSSGVHRIQLNLLFLVVICAVYIFILCVVIVQSDHDVSSLIHAGDRFTSSPQSTIAVQRDSYGYDGQFYYRLALDPFTSQRTAFGITLDQPALRHQRILYPLLVWLLSFGISAYVPFSMVLVNIVALIGIAILSARIAQAANKQHLSSLLLIVSPALLICLTRNLTEMVAAFFIISAYYCFTKQRHWCASLLFSLAVLSRETTLIIPFMIGSYYFYRSIRMKDRALILNSSAYAIPVVIYGLWQVLLFFNWGSIPLFSSGGLNLGRPFEGFLYAVTYIPTISTQVRVFEVLLLVFMGVMTAVSMRRSSVSMPIRISWVAYAALVVVYSKWIWSDDWSFLRVMMEMVLVGGLIIMYTDSNRLRRYYGVTLLVLFFIIAGKIIV